MHPLVIILHYCLCIVLLLILVITSSESRSLAKHNGNQTFTCIATYTFSIRCFQNAPCDKHVDDWAISSDTIKLAFTAVTFANLLCCERRLAMFGGTALLQRRYTSFPPLSTNVYLFSCLSLHCLPSASNFLFLDILG